MEFVHPSYLRLLLLIIPFTAFYIWKIVKSYPSLSLSTTRQFERVPRSWKEYLNHALFLLRMAAFACLVVVIARPQTTDHWSTQRTEGTDIIISLDISTSMLSQDFKPNRFEAAKNVATQFALSREYDNIGVVIFAGESFTAVPMTVNHAAVANYIKDIKIGMIEDGTAIGDGLATAINRIRDGKAKSKSIILLTDGSNNTGIVAPNTAAEIAKNLGIKVYTVGVGRNGMAPSPSIDIFGRLVYTNQPVVIDEESLKKIASTTGGKYFRATSNSVLKEIFSEIDKLEKTEMDVKNFSHAQDDYEKWAWAALAFLLLEIFIRKIILRRLP